MTTIEIIESQAQKMFGTKMPASDVMIIVKWYVLEHRNPTLVRALLWPGCIVARPIPGMPKATILQCNGF